MNPAPNARERSEWTERLAAVIREQRLERHMTQQHVADGAGMPLRQYVRLEYGERVPDVSQLARIASVFGLRASDLLRLAE